MGPDTTAHSHAFGPLAGLTVLDLTRALSGPYATLLLGGLGATVIKVEDPNGGDVARGNVPYLGRTGVTATPSHDDDVSLPFLERGRGKYGVTLDLKHPRAGEVFADLVSVSDVIVENFSAGTADRLGVGYAVARALKPSIVYTSISGFGADGHDDGKAYDLVTQALSGIVMASGEPEDGPERVGLPLGDLVAPLFALGGTLAAVLSARATGLGQHVDVSMLGALTSLVAVEPWDGYRHVGMPSRTGNMLNRLAPFGIFATIDGHVAICAANARMYAKLPGAIGRPDLLDDPRFAHRAVRAANADEIHAIIADWTAQRSTADVIATLRDADVPVAPVREPHEALRDRRVLDRGEVVPLEHPVYGRAEELLASGVPIRFSETPAGFSSPAPLLGQHNQRVFGQLLGYDDRHLADLRASGVFGEGR